MKLKILRMFFISIFLASIVNAQQIEITECSSGKEPWTCYRNELCICRISGTCTDGILMIYKDSIQDAFCLPSIEKGISAIYLDDCNIQIGEVKVKAFCSEGNSVEKTIRVLEKVVEAKTTTTIPLKENTTTRECSKVGDSCAYQNCCEGLHCCEDMICKEVCEEENRETNFWIIIIPIILLIIVIVSFLIIKKRGETE